MGDALPIVLSFDVFEGLSDEESNLVGEDHRTVGRSGGSGGGAGGGYDSDSGFDSASRGGSYSDDGGEGAVEDGRSDRGGPSRQSVSAAAASPPRLHAQRPAASPHQQQQQQQRAPVPGSRTHAHRHHQQQQQQQQQPRAAPPPPLAAAAAAADDAHGEAATERRLQNYLYLVSRHPERFPVGPKLRSVMDEQTRRGVRCAFGGMRARCLHERCMQRLDSACSSCFCMQQATRFPCSPVLMQHASHANQPHANRLHATREYYRVEHLKRLVQWEAQTPLRSRGRGAYCKDVHERGCKACATCHFCRQKTVDPKTWCACENARGDLEGGRKRGVWCGFCLEKRLGENIHEVCGRLGVSAGVGLGGVKRILVFVAGGVQGKVWGCGSR